MRNDGVRQLLGEVVQLRQPVKFQVGVVEAVVADVVVDIRDLKQRGRRGRIDGQSNEDLVHRDKTAREGGRQG